MWVHLHSISFRSIYCSPIWSERLKPRMQNHRGLTIHYTWTFDHQEGQCPSPCTVQGSTVFAVRACFQSTSFPVPLPHSSSATVSPCLRRILSPKTNSCQTPLSHPRLNGISFLLISLQPFSLTWYQERGTRSNKITIVIKKGMRPSSLTQQIHSQKNCKQTQYFDTTCIHI